MASLDYIEVPPSAVRLQPQSATNQSRVQQIRRAPTIITALPQPPRPTPIHRRTDSASSIASPKAAVNLIPQLLLSSLPSTTQGSSNPRASQQSNTLLSSRDPLSVPILTVNFKRFIERVGPVFWLQDRIEEIILFTGTWIAAYAFICYFPRLLLLLPQIILIGIILATHPDTTHKPPPVPNAPPEAGSVDWQANIQAIQNLMGFVADVETAIQPYIPYFTHRKPHTNHILTLLLISLLPMLFLVSLPVFPIRGVCLFMGIAPLLLTHPVISAMLPGLYDAALTRAEASPLLGKLRNKLAGTGPAAAPRSWRSLAVRVVDDANLTDECWVAQKREVELFENERFGSADDGHQREWSKANLRDGERAGWTRGRDGWSGVGGQGSVSSNLTFSLDPGWAFIETEDWRADLEARWAGGGEPGQASAGDNDGWVYTNDAWTDLRPPSASYSPGVGGVTRRRRWVRRIWYDHTKAVSML
ncbi:integral peroxisomal membrane peroxin-domain-containing protein [Roridomyces roridus]|uniref:Integral peroxisomal membrane peroxin-domain-containing protein n=1 Tax=Roridomyces roridus TaxID=1738132 RepID=A0AAD7FHY9_9AGAR|nr:integral peroxisomal membrane peroxin-domain-containing protein [Roridomyces roridus]